MGNKQTINDREIDMLRTRTDMSRAEVLDWHRKFLANYPKGTIDNKQFAELYKQTKFEKFAHVAFVLFDDDLNGKLSFSQFILATEQLEILSSMEEKLLKV
jgi:Ca2+-binding EF-hand superfamily protein